jgi:hypothetical protein
MIGRRPGMPGVRWFALLLVPLAALTVACGDDDGDESPTDAATETPAGVTTAAPTGETPADTGAATATTSPTPVNELTEEMIAAASTYLTTAADVAYEVTDPPECEAITALIEAGEAEVSDFVGENLVCLIGAEFDDGEVRLGFGPYASEVIGVVVLEETEAGGWRGIAIEPGPTGI